MSVYLCVELPYPNRILFPNGRAHWRARAKSAKAYRAAGFFYTSQAIGMGPKPKIPEEGKVGVRLTFYPPDHRIRDEDNQLAAMKSALDGVADALGINDKKFHILEPIFKEEVVKGGKVVVTLDFLPRTSKKAA